jgi:hypothetical protein
MVIGSTTMLKVFLGTLSGSVNIVKISQDIVTGFQDVATDYQDMLTGSQDIVNAP